MVFHWILSDSNSPQISRTLLSILADLNYALVCMVSIRPLISKILLLNLENQAFSIPVSNWMILLWSLCSHWTLIFFNHPISQYNGDHSEILIRILFPNVKHEMSSLKAVTTGTKRVHGTSSLNFKNLKTGTSLAYNKTQPKYYEDLLVILIIFSNIKLFFYIWHQLK